MKSATKPTTPIYRSAVDGKFITREQARSNPRESVRETRPAPLQSPKKGR